MSVLRWKGEKLWNLFTKKKSGIFLETHREANNLCRLGEFASRPPRAQKHWFVMGRYASKSRSASNSSLFGVRMLRFRQIYHVSIFVGHAAWIEEPLLLPRLQLKNHAYSDSERKRGDSDSRAETIRPNMFVAQIFAGNHPTGHTTTTTTIPSHTTCRGQTTFTSTNGASRVG